jgi:hypothetical protein
VTAPAPTLVRSDRRVVRYRRPWMYDKQQRALFAAKRFMCIEASTKAGKTTGALFWLTEKAVLTPGPGKVFWWVAPSARQARIAYNRFKLYNAATSEKLWRGVDSRMEIHLANGNTLQFLTAEDPDLLYGEDVWAFVLDEASRARREAWLSLYSTMTKTRGEGRLIGNVRGRKNFFFELARRGESGDPDFGHALLTGYDAVEGGVLPLEAVENAKRDLTEVQFRELFLGIPSDDGGNPFGQQHLDAVKAALTGKPVVAWGADLAKSVDWTVLLGLDADCKVAALHRWQRPWKETLSECRRILRGAPTVMDATGVGDPIVELLQRAEGSEPAVPNLRGYVLTAASKQLVLERLAVRIQQRETSIPEGYPATEYEAFEYEVTRTHTRYAAPEGHHDDVVIAHALALEAWEDRRRAPSRGGALVTL